MPAPDLAVGDLLEVSIYTSLVAQLGVNRLRYLVTGYTGSATPLDQLPTYFAGIFSDPYKTLMSPAAMYRGVGVRRVIPAPATITYYSDTDAGPGVGSGAQLPSQVAPVIRLQTETAGPKGRGRMYVSFPRSGASDGNGNMSESFKGDVALLAQELGPTLSLQISGSFVDLQLVITRSPPGALQYVINQYPTGKFGTQRRRGNYGDTNDFPV